MKNKKHLIVAAFVALISLTLFLGGCGKKGESSTAIAITPTPSDTTTATPTVAATPSASANTVGGLSANGTNTSFAASGNMMVNNGISSNSTEGGSKITGTIVAASMEDVTVRTSEGAEYTCSTTNAVNNLSDGITLGNSITVTLASMSAVNGLYTATELNDISSAQAANSQNTGALGTGVAGTTGNEGLYDNDANINDSSLYNDGSLYSDGTVYDDGTGGLGTDTYTDYGDTSGMYDDTATYDDGSSDYYYYDPSAEIYDDSYSYY